MMHEVVRILSDRKRLVLFILLPVISLLLFFYNKCQCDLASWKEEAHDYSALVEQYRDTSPADIISSFDDLQCHTDNEYKLITAAEYLKSYPEYLEIVREHAENMQASSIFSEDKKSFTYRNIIKTAEDFSKCSPDGVRLGNYTAVEDLICFNSADWFFLAAVLLLVMSFLESNGRSLLAVINATPGGRGRLTGTRMGILACFSSVMTGLLYVVPIAVSFMIDGGLKDLSSPVQSVMGMQKCTAQITVSGFIVRYLVMKIAAGFLIGMLLWLVLSFIEGSQLSWVVASVLLTGEYLLYKNIPLHSVFSIFRDVNIFSFLFSGKIFTEYENTDLFSFPVGQSILLIWTVVIMIIAAGIALIVMSSKRYPLGRKGSASADMLLNRIGDALRSRMNLLGLEGYKIIFGSITGIALIACVAVTKTVNCSNGSYSNFDDRIYLQYIEMIKGPVTKETYEFIDEARDYIAEADMYVDEYEEALDRVEDYVNSLDEGDWVVDDTTLLNVYGERSWRVQRENGMIAAVFIVLSLSTLFAAEKSIDVKRVIRTTQKGRNYLFWIKYAVALVITVFIWYRVFRGEWKSVVLYLGSDMMVAPCSSYSVLSGYEMTLGCFLGILYLSKLLLMIILLNICMFVCAVFRSFEKCFLINGLLIVIPSFVYLIHVNDTCFYTPVSLLADKNPLLTWPKNSCVLLAWCAIGAISLITARREWDKTI